MGQMGNGTGAFTSTDAPTRQVTRALSTYNTSIFSTLPGRPSLFNYFI
jgi:hypothetical protein